jgi:hypothetical protein
VNDTQLDALLTRHGAMWRDANTAPPDIDWDRVAARSRRRSQATAGAVVAVAAVVVVAVIVSTNGSHPVVPEGLGAPAVAPLVPADALYGAPPRYFGLMRGGLYNRTVSSYGLIRVHPFVTAVGGTQQGTTVYSIRPAPSCRTRLEVTSYTTKDLLHGRGSALDGQVQPVATIAGQPTAAPIAVSVPSGELAIVVTRDSHRHHGAPRQSCTGRQQIVFVNMRNGAVIGRQPVVNPQLQIDALAWSDDGQQLAYRLSPDTDDTRVLTRATIAAAGTHLMAIHGSSHALEGNPKVLPLAAASGGPSYGPVFWWRGGFAVTDNGTLYRLDERGSLGAVLETDFPDRVDSVASDVTGEHLLIGSGELSYRWDFGQLAPLPGRLAEPTW